MNSQRLPRARRRPVRATRRGFLGLAGAGAALAALARLPSAAVAGLPTGAGAPRPTAVGEGHFSRREREILARIVDRMVASDDPAAPAASATGALDSLDRLCAGLAPELTRPLGPLLRLVDWGPLLFELRLARFTASDDDACDASLRGWMSSRFALRRQAFQALRNLAFLGYYSQEESWAAIGYRGPLLGRTGAT